MIRNERENVITNPIDIKKYYELCFMLINLITKFPEMHKLPKQTQEQKIFMALHLLKKLSS